MKNVTAKFWLSEIDHDELLKFLEVRFQTGWRVSGPGRGSRTEIDVPATKDFALRVRHKQGKIEDIFLGPALPKKKDLETLLDEINANLRDATTKEYGRGVLLAPRPVRGSFTSSSVPLQIIPAPADTARPNYLHAQHPFVLEFPIRSWQLPQLRLWRRFKTLAEWAWVLGVVLDGTFHFEGPRYRHMWVRSPGDDGIYFFGTEAYPPAAPEAVAATFSTPGALLPIVPAATYYADWRSGLRATMPLDEFVVPDDLDRSLGAFAGLVGDERRRFLSAAATIHIAADLWDVSISSYFLACVQAIECVAQDMPRVRRTFLWRRKIGPSRRFRQICELHGSAAGVDGSVLKRLYAVRSDVTHGEYLFDIDRHPWGMGTIGSVLGLGDMEAAESAIRLAKCVLRSWLFSRPH